MGAGISGPLAEQQALLTAVSPAPRIAFILLFEIGSYHAAQTDLKVAISFLSPSSSGFANVHCHAQLPYPV